VRRTAALGLDLVDSRGRGSAPAQRCPGRTTAGQAAHAVRLVPVLLGVVLLGYLAGLVHEISQPRVPAQNQQLTSWLEAHHLRGGLSGYWQSNVITLTSGDRV
jgi:hypothetical protein